MKVHLHSLIPIAVPLDVMLVGRYHPTQKRTTIPPYKRNPTFTMCTDRIRHFSAQGIVCRIPTIFFPKIASPEPALDASLREGARNDNRLIRPSSLIEALESRIPPLTGRSRILTIRAWWNWRGKTWAVARCQITDAWQGHQHLPPFSFRMCEAQGASCVPIRAARRKQR